MDQQQQLPLDPRERLALIRAASSRLPLSAPRRHNVQLLLEQLEAHTAQQSLTTEFLAAVMFRSPRTVRRAVRDAENHHILAVARHPGQSGSGGQTANTYRVQWDALRTIARGTVPQPPIGSRGQAGGQRGSPRCQDGQAGGQVGSALARFLIKEPPLGGSDINKSTSSSFLPNRQPQRAWCPGAQEITDHGADWREVEEELVSTGMGDIEGVMRRVRGRCTPADVLAIIAHWRSKPGAWGLGALHMRLRFVSPGCDPAKCWVPESEAWRREQKNRAQSAYAQERRRQEVAHRAAAAKQQAALDLLEALYGGTLDALPADELASLAAEAFGHCPNPAFYHSMLRRSDRTNCNLRPLLLEALQRRIVGAKSPQEVSNAQVSR